VVYLPGGDPLVSSADSDSIRLYGNNRTGFNFISVKTEHTETCQTLLPRREINKSDNSGMRGSPDDCQLTKILV
jgi:hypothetical protein